MVHAASTAHSCATQRAYILIDPSPATITNTTTTANLNTTPLNRIRDYWHRPDDVLAGLVLGSAAAYWSFRFVVLMPFDHEIGTPQWTANPKWVEEEERQWAEEEEELRLCPWKGRRKNPRIRADSTEGADKLARPLPVRWHCGDGGGGSDSCGNSGGVVGPFCCQELCLSFGRLFA